MGPEKGFIYLSWFSSWRKFLEDIIGLIAFNAKAAYAACHQAPQSTVSLESFLPGNCFERESVCHCDNKRTESTTRAGCAKCWLHSSHVRVNGLYTLDIWFFCETSESLNQQSPRVITEKRSAARQQSHQDNRVPSRAWSAPRDTTLILRGSCRFPMHNTEDWLWNQLAWNALDWNIVFVSVEVVKPPLRTRYWE